MIAWYPRKKNETLNHRYNFIFVYIYLAIWGNLHVYNHRDLKT